MNKLLLFIVLLPFAVFGQTDPGTPASKKIESIKFHWYEKISLRGYMQVRYNRLLETNDKLKCEQCDRSWGENGGVFIRRLRLVFSGQLSERIFFYVQPDLASSTSSTALNFLQLRDAYVDLGIDRKNEFRFRLGQSKVPFGFENLQSSQVRMSLDRDDALNSALVNERDLGVFFYWAPDQIRKRFASLVSDGLKGSGDFGVFAIGAFNGQTMNKPELNNEQHVVARLTYPFKLGSQIIEPSVQAYTGHFVIPADQISPGVKTVPGKSYLDQRVAASFVLYPHPFGFQAEYNIGKGPEFDPATDSIESKSVTGGYATLSYALRIKDQLLYPYMRMQYYSGGKKQELDARSYEVDEYEVGLEWLPIKYLELTAQYTISKRRFEDFKTKGNIQEGSLLRLQAQVNF